MKIDKKIGFGFSNLAIFFYRTFLCDKKTKTEISGFSGIRNIIYVLLIFGVIFGTSYASAGGCGCYAGSCLSEINASKMSVNAASAYLKVDMFVDDCLTIVGDEIGYTIVVRNLGNNTAHYVTVKDELPRDISVEYDSMVFISDGVNYTGEINCHFESNGQTVTGKVLKCNIPYIQKSGLDGDTVTIYFKAKVKSHEQIGNHTNTVEVNGFYAAWGATGCWTEPIPDVCLQTGSCESNKSCVSTECCTWAYGESDVATNQPNPATYSGNEFARNESARIGAADLKDNVTVRIIEMNTIALDPYAANGSTIEYEIQFSTDDKQMNNVTIKDDLPEGFTYVEESVEWTPAPKSKCNYSNITYDNSTGTFILNNVSGSICIFTYEVSISGTQENGIYANNATFKGDTDSGSIEIIDTADVEIISDARITVNKDVNEFKIFEPGDVVPYTIQVCNPGGAVAQDIHLTDFVPYGYNFSSAVDNEGVRYIPNSEAESGDVCSITDRIPISENTTNVSVECIQKEGNTTNDTHTIIIGSQVTHTDADCSYTINCTDNETCTIINTCQLVRVEGDPFYSNSTVGYKLRWYMESLAPHTCWHIAVNFSVLSGAAGRASVNKVEVNASGGLLWKDIAYSVFVDFLLTIQKSVENATAAPGQDVWYGIHIYNFGDVNATNLTVIDDPSEPLQDSADIKDIQCNGVSLNDTYVRMVSPADQNPGYGDTVIYKIENITLEPRQFCTFKYKARINHLATEGLYSNYAILSADYKYWKAPEISAAAFLSVVYPTCNCSTCDECEEKLNDPSCFVVTLNESIMNHSGTCINNPANFTNKIFDCQGFTIEGDDSGADYGIYLDGKQNNTIKNCIITEFSNGIRLSGSNNNKIINNTAKDNNYNGIFLSAASDNNLTSNSVCNNNNSDIEIINSTGNTGDNTCDNLNNDGNSVTCNTSCPAPKPNCTIPMDNLYLNSSTTLCSGIYNLTDSGEKGVIIINADDVVLDCNGSSLIGIKDGFDVLYAVHNIGFKNITIKNCNFYNFTYGIYVKNSRNVTIINNTITSSKYSGISIHNSSLIKIINSTINSSAYRGIDTHSCSDVTIKNNKIISTFDCGIHNWYTQNILIEDNQIYNNIQQGIQLYECWNSSIINNEILSNTNRGVLLLFSRHNFIFNNSLHFNGISIFSDGSGNTTIEQNTINSNNIGIRIINSVNYLYENKVCNNEQYDLQSDNKSTNHGINNLCDKINNWNDDEKAGCTYTCNGSYNENDTIYGDGNGNGNETELSPACINANKLQLKSGWNLISLPIQPKNNNLHEVLKPIDGHYTDVFTYHTGEWHYKSKYLDKWFGSLDEMDIGWGYWIKVDQDINLTLNGDEAGDWCVPLVPGWNLIGPAECTIIGIGNLSFTDPDGNVEYTDLFGYYEDGNWHYKSKYLNKWFGELNELKPAKGYWIKVEEECTMSIN